MLFVKTFCFFLTVYFMFMCYFQLYDLLTLLPLCHITPVQKNSTQTSWQFLLMKKLQKSDLAHSAIKKLLWPFCIPLSTSQCKIIINFLNTLLRIKSLVETVEHSQVFPWHLILPHSLGLNGLYTYLDISVFYYSGLMVLWFQDYPNTFLYETCVVKLFMFSLVPAFIYYHGFRNKIKVLKRWSIFRALKPWLKSSRLLLNLIRRTGVKNSPLEPCQWFKI